MQKISIEPLIVASCNKCEGAIFAENFGAGLCLVGHAVVM